LDIFNFPEPFKYKNMYAILDIETTGGKYNEEGITEIAIYRFDGHEITDRFSSLINPERKIQPFVAKLTGINNNMLKSAPKFYEVAKRIVEITEGCTLVAHNAKFDSRILSTEFRRLGYNYYKNSICTVQLSKKLLPNMPSYSLGKLTKSLGIPLRNRHRAQGDALATVELFKLLLNKDTSKNIVSSYINKKHTQDNNSKLIYLLDTVPTETGVYYLYNKKNKIIYIGLGKNIRKTVNQNFISLHSKYKKIQQEVSRISYELTGNLLIASLKKAEDIKCIQPVFSTQNNKPLFPYQLISSKDNKGYICLHIEKTDLRKNALMSFISSEEALRKLRQITEDYQLCYSKNKLESMENIGSQTRKLSVENYNNRVQKFIKDIKNDTSYFLIDKGRKIGEHSVILIENGSYKGYGFFNLNHQINDRKIIDQILNPPVNSRYAKHIIDYYLTENSVQKIIEIPKQN